MDPQQKQIVIVKEPRSMGVAYVLWFFLGMFGAHRFYVGRDGSAVAQLALNIVGLLTIWLIIGILPLVVVWIWWLADLFLTAGMVREANERLGVTAAVAVPGHIRATEADE